LQELADNLSTQIFACSFTGAVFAAINAGVTSRKNRKCSTHKQIPNNK